MTLETKDHTGVSVRFQTGFSWEDAPCMQVAPFQELQSLIEQKDRVRQAAGLISLCFPAVVATSSMASCFCLCELPIMMDGSPEQSAKISASFLQLLLSEHFITGTTKLLSNKTWSSSLQMLLHLKLCQFRNLQRISHVSLSVCNLHIVLSLFWLGQGVNPHAHLLLCFMSGCCPLLSAITCISPSVS